jgi:hypothetical protein
MLHNLVEASIDLFRYPAKHVPMPDMGPLHAREDDLSKAVASDTELRRGRIVWTVQARWWNVVRPTVNALYSAGGHVQRLLPLFVIQGLRDDHFASCLAGPGVFDHRQGSPFGIRFLA